MHPKVLYFLLDHSRKTMLVEWENALLSRHGIECPKRHEDDTVFLVPNKYMGVTVESALASGLKESKSLKPVYASEWMPGARSFVLGERTYKGSYGQNVKHTNRLVFVPMKFTGLTTDDLQFHPIDCGSPEWEVHTYALPVPSACKALARIIHKKNMKPFGVAIYGSQLRNLIGVHTYGKHWKHVWFPNAPLQEKHKALMVKGIEDLAEWEIASKDNWMVDYFYNIITKRSTILAPHPK